MAELQDGRNLGPWWLISWSRATRPTWIFLSFFFFLICFGCAVGREILIPQPGIESVPSAVEAWNLNHWTAREVPNLDF